MTEKLRLHTLPFTGAVGENTIFGVSVATTGEALGHRLLFDQLTLQQLADLGNAKTGGIKSRFTHPDWLGVHDGLGTYLGRVKNFYIHEQSLRGDLHISAAARKSPAGDLAAYVLSLAAEDPASFGVSVVIDLDRVWKTRTGIEVPVKDGRPSDAVDKYPTARVTGLYAADLVDDPALNPEGLFRAPNGVCGAQGLFRTPSEACGAQGLFQNPLNPLQNPLLQGEMQEMKDQIPTQSSTEDISHETQLNRSWDGVPLNQSVKSVSKSAVDRLAQLEETISRLQAAVENTVINIGGLPPRGQQLTSGSHQIEQFQGYFDWLFGAPGAKLPPPELRRADALYRAITGDIDMTGRFDASRAAFAAANTTTLADLAVNAMNKVVLDLYTNLTAYRWFEQIVAVQATDGTLQDMEWLQMGGVVNLPVVAEGAAYTELDVTDTKESSSFTKYGGYVGITDKMIRNSQIDRLQAVPRALTISAIRTRSAAIASIFTTAAALGPTLAQDSKALFIADNSHGNYATTAFSIAAWKAARLQMAKQAELGSSKRQVLWPKYCLVPVDLYDDALVVFGYGQGPGGYPATTNNDVNPYASDRPGDPRPIVVCVPEWTDTTNWGFITDPRIFPVICMAYADNPGGTSHPAPQLYTATDPLSGLLFTNDTLPIKVRDQWAYGVATWRGIGNRVVAGA